MSVCSFLVPNVFTENIVHSVCMLLLSPNIVLSPLNSLIVPPVLATNEVGASQLAETLACSFILDLLID